MSAFQHSPLCSGNGIAPNPGCSCGLVEWLYREAARALGVESLSAVLRRSGWVELLWGTRADLSNILFYENLSRPTYLALTARIQEIDAALAAVQPLSADEQRRRAGEVAERLKGWTTAGAGEPEARAVLLGLLLDAPEHTLRVGNRRIDAERDRWALERWVDVQADVTVYRLVERGTPDKSSDAAQVQGKAYNTIVEDDIELPLQGSNLDSPDPEAGPKADHVG